MREWALQQAVYAVLSTNVDLAALGAGVYDHIPQEAEFPCVVIGEDYASRADTDDTLDADHMLSLHTWSRVEGDGTGHRGLREIKLMQQACYKALHRQSLTVEGASVTDIYIEDSDNFRDGDGLTRHGVQRFVVLLDGVTP